MCVVSFTTLSFNYQIHLFISLVLSLFYYQKRPIFPIPFQIFFLKVNPLFIFSPIRFFFCYSKISIHFFIYIIFHKFIFNQSFSSFLSLFFFFLLLFAFFVLVSACFICLLIYFFLFYSPSIFYWGIMDAYPTLNRYLIFLIFFFCVRNFKKIPPPKKTIVLFYTILCFYIHSFIHLFISTFSILSL